MSRDWNRSNVDWNAVRQWQSGSRLRPATAETVRIVDDVIWHLREARRLLAIADCPQTMKRVRVAIASAKGARRHAERREMESERRS